MPDEEQKKHAVFLRLRSAPSQECKFYQKVRGLWVDAVVTSPGTRSFGFGAAGEGGGVGFSDRRVSRFLLKDLI